MNNLISIAYAGVITDAPSVASLGYGILEFLLTVVGALMVIAFVIAGSMFLLAQGDYRALDKAKKAMTYSLIGAVMALGSMLILRLLASLTAGTV